MGDDLLDDFIRTNRERSLGAYGIHLYREGSPPVERRVRSDDRVNLYSVAKTFTSVALGLAEAEGRLSLDDRLLDHFPELRAIAADGFEEITLRQLVTMTSGTSHQWFADVRINAGDLLHEIVAAPLDAPPGTRFSYTDSGPYAIGRVIARTTGADLRSYLLPRLFAPLDLHNPAWHTCPRGFPFAGSDLFLRTHELARFAQLLLQDGQWDGRQILPVTYVQRMTTERVDTSTITDGERFTYGYGLGVWIDLSGISHGRPLRPIRPRLPPSAGYRNGDRALRTRGRPARCDTRVGRRSTGMTLLPPGRSLPSTLPHPRLVLQEPASWRPGSA